MALEVLMLYGINHNMFGPCDPKRGGGGAGRTGIAS